MEDALVRNLSDVFTHGKTYDFSYPLKTRNLQIPSAQ